LREGREEKSGHEILAQNATLLLCGHCKVWITVS